MRGVAHVIFPLVRNCHDSETRQAQRRGCRALFCHPLTPTDHAPVRVWVCVAYKKIQAVFPNPAGVFFMRGLRKICKSDPAGLRLPRRSLSRDALSCQFRRWLARLQWEYFSFYNPAVRAFKVLECKVAASWMCLDNGLHYWLVALRAGVMDKQVQRHDEFLSR